MVAVMEGPPVAARMTTGSEFMTRTFRTFGPLLAATAMLALAPELASAQAAGGARGARANDDGGVTAGRVGGVRNDAGGVTRGAGVRTGADGSAIGGRFGAGAGEQGAFARGRGAQLDENGAGRGGSFGCAAGAAGEACRAARFERGEDGSFRRESGAGFEGADGAWGRSFGEVERDADGNVTGFRETAAEGERGRYSAETAYDNDHLERSAEASNDDGAVSVEQRWARGEGGERIVTCYDAWGVEVTCPTPE